MSRRLQPWRRSNGQHHRRQPSRTIFAVIVVVVALVEVVERRFSSPQRHYRRKQHLNLAAGNWNSSIRCCCWLASWSFGVRERECGEVAKKQGSVFSFVWTDKHARRRRMNQSVRPSVSKWARTAVCPSVFSLLTSYSYNRGGRCSIDPALRPRVRWPKEFQKVTDIAGVESENAKTPPPRTNRSSSTTRGMTRPTVFIFIRDRAFAHPSMPTRP